MGKSENVNAIRSFILRAIEGKTLAYKTKANISYTTLLFTFHKMTNFLPLPHTHTKQPRYSILDLPY